MAFGRKFMNFPTPESVVWRYTIANRVAGGMIVMLQGWEFIPDIPKHIATGILGLFLGLSKDIQDMYGVKVPPLVPGKDVEVIKDDTIKTLLFFLLCGIPFFF